MSRGFAYEWYKCFRPQLEHFCLTVRMIYAPAVAATSTSRTTVLQQWQLQQRLHLQLERLPCALPPEFQA